MKRWIDVIGECMREGNCAKRCKGYEWVEDESWERTGQPLLAGKNLPGCCKVVELTNRSEHSLHNGKVLLSAGGIATYRHFWHVPIHFSQKLKNSQLQ